MERSYIAERGTVCPMYVQRKESQLENAPHARYLGCHTIVLNKMYGGPEVHT